jgi:hypothetical protein
MFHKSVFVPTLEHKGIICRVIKRKWGNQSLSRIRKVRRNEKRNNAL